MSIADLYDPVIDGVQHITYRRNPTKAEIAFGYGATHYKHFPIEKCKTGRFYSWGAPILKKWLKGDDGLRYYRF